MILHVVHLSQISKRKFINWNNISISGHVLELTSTTEINKSPILLMKISNFWLYKTESKIIYNICHLHSNCIYVSNRSQIRLYSRTCFYLHIYVYGFLQLITITCINLHVNMIFLNFDLLFLHINLIYLEFNMHVRGKKKKNASIIFIRILFNSFLYTYKFCK